MGYTSVRTHTRRGYQVRAHSRRTSGLVPGAATPRGCAIQRQPDTRVLLHGLRGESASR